jgi:hypothetical protein
MNWRRAIWAVASWQATRCKQIRLISMALDSDSTVLKKGNVRRGGA